MTLLHLVRHGETDWNRAGRFQGTRDIPLNETGREQVQRLALSFAVQQPVLISSPLLRTVESAEILAKAWGVESVATDPLLIERSYGSAEGLTYDQRRDLFPEGVVPDMETIDQVKARAAAFLSRVSTQGDDKIVVVVSHGGLINALLSWVSHGAVGTGKTLLANASVSTVVWNGSTGTVRSAGIVAEDVPLALRE